MLVAVSSYTEAMPHVPGTLGKGVYTYRLDEVGKVSPTEAAPFEMKNPSYLLKHPSLPMLYACGENDPDTADNCIQALKYDAETGALEAAHPPLVLPAGAACHMDSDGTFLVVACYLPSKGSTAGDVHLLEILEDGSLKLVDTFKTTGEPSDKAGDTARNGIQAGRQEASHPHMAYCYKLPDGRTGVLVPDLGCDVVYKLAIKKEEQKFEFLGLAKVEIGTGPRHCAVDQQGANVAYVIGELANTLDVLDLETMTSVQRVSTLPADVLSMNPSDYLSGNPFFCEKVGASACSGLKLAPNGKKLYGSNRGHDSLSLFDLKDGRVSLETVFSTRGQTPRDFYVDAEGRFVVALNQDSGSLVTFMPSGQEAGVDFQTGYAPVCMIAL